MGENSAGGSAVVTCRWLVLRLDAPLMSFGGVAIDQVGPVRDFPATSMLTGLIGNAFGWHWSDSVAHQTMQDRLVFAALCEREGVPLTDTQNALLNKNDKSWTTYGKPEGRDGGAKSYEAPRRRLRDYHADSSVIVVLRLDQPSESPTLDAVASALDRPARPLFLGRKPCLPSRPLLDREPIRWIIAETAHEALCKVPCEGRKLRGLWPLGQGPDKGDGIDRVVDLADMRNWRTGLHVGSRQIVEGRISPVTSE